MLRRTWEGGCLYSHYASPTMLHMFQHSCKALAVSRRYVIFSFIHCGRFLDRFHVHNQGIIYSEEHSLGNFEQSEKELVIVVQ